MMASNSYPHHRPQTALAVTLSWRGRPRTLRAGRTMALALFGVLPLLAIWYLGATAYLVFHDQLLASLISRQADIQYAYEDRIAVLKTQLDRSTSRALVDRQTLATTISDLVSRSERLQEHALTIDTLVGSLAKSGHGGTQSTESDSALLSTPSSLLPADGSAFDLSPSSPASLGSVPASSLRLNGSTDKGAANDNDAPDENHVELSPEQQGEKLITVLAAVEARQSAEVARLRDPLIRAVAGLQTALAETGLPLSRWNLSPRHEGDIGGPFVPLPEGAMSFEQNVALLQDAVVQNARLTFVIETVPLRRPLEGQLQVTSPFGARLDPFFGRAAMHTGVDLMQPYGGPVLATANGTVTVAGAEGGYGNMVEIDHGNGIVTRYAHLSSIDVVAHQKISAGAIVGRVGSTGRATGPHLHYETRINGEPVDPTRFLKAGAALFPG